MKIKNKIGLFFILIGICFISWEIYSSNKALSIKKANFAGYLSKEEFKRISSTLDEQLNFGYYIKEPEVLLGLVFIAMGFLIIFNNFIMSLLSQFEILFLRYFNPRKFSTKLKIIRNSLILLIIMYSISYLKFVKNTNGRVGIFNSYMLSLGLHENEINNNIQNKNYNSSQINNIVYIFIQADGTILFNNEKIELENIYIETKKILSRNSNLIFSIQADPSVKFQIYSKILGELKKNPDVKITITD